MPAKKNKHALDSNKPIVFVLSTISPPHVKRLFIETIFAPFVGNFAVAHGVAATEPSEGCAGVPYKPKQVCEGNLAL